MPPRIVTRITAYLLLAALFGIEGGGKELSGADSEDADWQDAQDQAENTQRRNAKNGLFSDDLPLPGETWK